MCRILTYLGEPIRIKDLLYQPDRALVRQAYNPKMLNMLNLAGFGMAAWDSTSLDPEIPFTYHSTTVPVFDRNVHGLSHKLRAQALVAHIRGVASHKGGTIGEQNLHPFLYDGYRKRLLRNAGLTL